MPQLLKCSLADRINQLPWAELLETLETQGFVTTTPLLSAEECQELAMLYDTSPESFRSRVVMQRHAFGKGEYQYFSYPLPEKIETLRQTVYPRLVPLANCWQSRMGNNTQYPEQLTEFLHRCHQAGQTRPTPLLLKYGPKDYNCLHQDLYGDHVFPIQMTILLSSPGEDFTGGEFTMVEQRPRMQSRPYVVPLQQGQAVLFCVNQRPVQGSRGFYRVTMRHGISTIHAGQRFSSGIIFHDAQ